MHIQAEHQHTRYDCNVCFKQFKRKGSLGRHMVGMHGQGDHKYACSICAKEFKQKTHLNTHLKNIHQQGVVVSIQTTPQTLVRSGTLTTVVQGRPTQVPPPTVIRTINQPQHQQQIQMMPQQQHSFTHI
jgi:DNA-directed RNA polymerase subunit RPC12/RpoP